MISDEVIGNYLNCKYKAYRKLNNEQGVKKEYELFQKEQLSELKTKFYDSLLKQHGEDKLLHGFKFGSNSRISKVNVIIQPTLEIEAFQISFDAMDIDSNKNSSLKKLMIPVVVIPNETISKIGKLSICIKCIVLSQSYGMDFEFGKIVYGSDLKILKFKIEPFLMEAKRMLNELTEMTKGEFRPILFQKSHCKICEFQEACKKELIKQDSLGLLSRMDEKEIKKHNNKGIFTVTQLSYTFRPRKRNKRVKTNQHPYYFPLQALAIREQKIFLYDKVNMPNAKTRVFIDMEGYLHGSFVYLIGILIVENEREIKHSLWADSPDKEKEIFNGCLKILEGLTDVHLFYFGKYESKVFKRMLKCNPTKKVKDLLLNKSTNILTIIHSNLYFPTYSNSLKDIGKYLGCTWSNADLTGIQTIAWRKKWEKSNDAELKEALIKYNYEDCIALKTLIDFVYTVFNEDVSEKLDSKLQNVTFVKNIEDDEKLPWEDKKFALEDIEVVTKCAYFEHQQNKIFFRTNKNIQKRNQRRKKQTKPKYKANKIIMFDSYKCPICKSKNIYRDKDKFHKKVCFDLRIVPYQIKKWIAIYYAPFYFCNNCQQSFKSKKITQQRRYGHTLMVWTIHQHVVNSISIESLKKTAEDYFGLPVNFKEMWKFKIKIAKYYSGTYNKILKKILEGHLIHADETKINLKEYSGYVWVLTNMEEVFYLYRPTRESSFLHDLLKGFDGVLVTDFYSGYDSLNCLQQKCLVHLIRDLNNALLKNPLDDELKELVIMFGRLVRTIIDTIDRFGLKSRYMKKHKKDVKTFYKKIMGKTYSSNITETFRKRMIKYEKKLFLFLNYDNVPWNNNNAEHAIKHFAKYRRLVDGKITQHGLEAYLILLSIYQTCNYKGINFLDFLLSKERDIDKFNMKH